MKSDFRFESFKGKSSSNLFDHNLMIGCPKRNGGNYTKKAFEQRIKETQIKIQLWVRVNWTSNNQALCPVWWCMYFISLYSLLHSDRDAIPEVPAIYFVLPSEENVKRICQVGNILIYYLNKVCLSTVFCIISLITEGEYVIRLLVIF